MHFGQQTKYDKICISEKAPKNMHFEYAFLKRPQKNMHFEYAFWDFRYAFLTLVAVGLPKLINLRGPPPIPQPPRNKALIRAYLPSVSINKALLAPYFLGGNGIGGGE